MIRTFAALVAVTVVVLLLPSSAVAAEAERTCGNGGTTTTSPRDIRVTGVDCATGKRLARRHANRTGKKERCDLRKASCSLDGWTCKRRGSGDAATQVSCKLSFGRVTWLYGA